MLVGKDLARQYNRDANRLERHNESLKAVRAIADLVGQRAKRELKEFEGLVLPERKRHPATLLGILAVQDKIQLILPVCAPIPLYPHTFRPNIPPEAMAGIRAANILTGEFADRLGICVTATVLLADTETDLEPVMERAGGVDRYLDVCAESVGMIAAKLRHDEYAETFSGHFGSNDLEPGYHALQYAAEGSLYARMEHDSEFAESMRNISKTRSTKHAEILGRQEYNHELAIRYAGQYTALGDYIRDSEFDAVCNYPTPNNEFYNRADAEIVPLFESRIDRRLP